MSRRIIPLVLFAIAFAFVESSVVVYLRSIYYPDGFTFPLRMIQPEHLWVELVREFSTILMLAAVGILAGTTRWQRFAFFLVAFGVWDIFYYVWLKVILDWPSSLLDWDILFLIPVPWIGPVIAPVLISLFMIAAGSSIIQKENQGQPFRPSVAASVFSSLGTLIILYAFMQDTNATLKMNNPGPFSYAVFFLGLACYIAATIYEFVLKGKRRELEDAGAAATRGR